MKPAICLLCGKAAADTVGSSQGDWVQFAEYAEASIHSLAHPQGLEYFCDEHLAAAQALASRPSQDGTRRFAAAVGRGLPHPPRPRQTQPGWRRLIGGLLCLSAQEGDKPLDDSGIGTLALRGTQPNSSVLQVMPNPSINRDNPRQLASRRQATTTIEPTATTSYNHAILFLHRQSS